MEIIGALMLAAPFIGLFVYMAINSDIATALKCFGLLALVVFWMIAAMYFINGGHF